MGETGNLAPASFDCSALPILLPQKDKNIKGAYFKGWQKASQDPRCWAPQVDTLITQSIGDRRFRPRGSGGGGGRRELVGESSAGGARLGLGFAELGN